MERKKSNFLLFADDVIIYISDPPKLYQGTPTADNTFSNMAGEKINSKKLVALIYTNGKEAEKGSEKDDPSL